MQSLTEVKGRLLGVDFGDVRTGLALSNEAQSMACGIGQIQVGGMQKTAQAVAEVVIQKQAAGVVVGLPVNMDGSHGPRAAHAEKFAGLLSQLVHVPVVMLDERMTTMAASRYLNETDTRGKKRKGVIDTLSAQIILQNALDKLSFLRSRERTPEPPDGPEPPGGESGESAGQEEKSEPAQEESQGGENP